MKNFSEKMHVKNFRGKIMRENLAFQKNKKLLWPPMLVALLSLLWLINDLGYLKTDIPVGPLALFCAALALLIYELRK